jgi:hypothetical protein
MQVPHRDRRLIWTGRAVTLVILAGLGWYFARVGWERASVIAGVAGLFAGLIALVAPYLLPAPQPPASPAPSPGPAVPPARQAVIGSSVGEDVRQVAGVGGSVRIGPSGASQPPIDPPPLAASADPALATGGSQVVDASTVNGSVTQVGDVSGDVDIDR